MDNVSIIGIDISKRSFQVHGATADGAPVLRRKLSRGKVLEFLAAQPPCLVVMEACGGAHHWGREIQQLGHEVRLIAPVYVKAFAPRGVANIEQLWEAFTECAESLPELVVSTTAVLFERVDELNAQLDELDKQMRRLVRENEELRRLTTIPQFSLDKALPVRKHDRLPHCRAPVRVIRGWVEQVRRRGVAAFTVCRPPPPPGRFAGDLTRDVDECLQLRTRRDSTETTSMTKSELSIRVAGKAALSRADAVLSTQCSPHAPAPSWTTRDRHRPRRRRGLRAGERRRSRCPLQRRTAGPRQSERNAATDPGAACGGDLRAPCRDTGRDERRHGSAEPHFRHRRKEGTLAPRGAAARQPTRLLASRQAVGSRKAESASRWRSSRQTHDNGRQGRQAANIVEGESRPVEERCVLGHGALPASGGHQ